EGKSGSKGSTHKRARSPSRRRWLAELVERASSRLQIQSSIRMATGELYCGAGQGCRSRILERLYIDNCLPLTVELFRQLAFFILSCKPISYAVFCLKKKKRRLQAPSPPTPLRQYGEEIYDKRSAYDYTTLYGRTVSSSVSRAGVT